jgi:hypothetical protein
MFDQSCHIVIIMLTFWLSPCHMCGSGEHWCSLSLMFDQLCDIIVIVLTPTPSRAFRQVAEENADTRP